MFGGATGSAGVASPPCTKQGPFTFGGETTQYPHVNARSRGLMGVRGPPPRARLAATLVVVLVCGALALRLHPSASTSTLVSGSSAAGQATAVAHQKFGDDAIYVLVRGDLARLVLTDDLNRLLGLEGCLSGNVPAGVTPPGGLDGPCAALKGSVRVVYGPGTFINSAVEQLTAQLQDRTRARAAQADRAKAAAIKLALSQGQSRGGGEPLRRRRREARLRAVRGGAAVAERQVRAQPDGRAAAQRPELRLPAGLRSGARRAHAQGALRLPVPVV